MVKYTDWSEERKAHKREVNKRWRDAHREEERERGRKYSAKEREEHPERVKARYKKWKTNNPERHKAIAKKSMAKRYATHTEELKKYTRNVALKWKYGITTGEYEAMVIAQNNRCAICNTDKPGGKSKRWCIDHDHKTKIVRRLLCHGCNNGLARFKDDIILLQRALDYLKAFS